MFSLRAKPRSSPSWMLLVAAGVAIGASWAPNPVRAEAERLAGVGVTSGARVYSNPLELQTEATVGVRVSMWLSDQLTVIVDGAHANPTRRTSGASSSFGDVRILAAYHPWRSRWSPYFVTGVGGQFFNFHDAPGTAGAVVAAGTGIEFEASRRWALFAEATANFYRAQYHVYTEFGTAVKSSVAATYATGALSLGAQVRF